MPFPNTRRVIYGKNPLAQVICQLRFPPILRIDTEVPAAFQDQLRAKFPGYAEQSKPGLQLPAGLEGMMPPEFMAAAVTRGTKNHQFISKDELWTVNLTRTFLAVSTTRYQRWEEFKEYLKDPLDALVEIYRPAYFDRIGLRYVDVFQRSLLGLKTAEWSELLQPHVLGPIGSEAIGKEIEAYEARALVNLENNAGQVRILTQFVLDETSRETCFVIDSDFFVEGKFEFAGAVQSLDVFNKKAGHLLQWGIMPRLHEALDPEAT